MPDIYHYIGSDLQVGPTGDLLTVDGITLGEQRVLRRLMTAIQGYIWHIEYGAGLPGYIGQPATTGQIQAVVLQQMKLEQAVQQNPPPVVTVSSYPDGTFFVSITYTNALTGTARLLEFDVDN